VKNETNCPDFKLEIQIAEKGAWDKVNMGQK
jgi:hypothetical protein